MFIQIMNRAMNEAIFHPVAAGGPVPAPASQRPAAVRRPERRNAGVRSAGSSSALPTIQIFARAFHTAVHGA